MLKNYGDALVITIIGDKWDGPLNLISPRDPSLAAPIQAQKEFNNGHYGSGVRLFSWQEIPALSINM